MTVQQVPPLAGAAVPVAPPRRGSTFQATLWALGGEAGSDIIRLLSSLILTRLLFPADFGLMAVVGLFMQGLNMFSDLGLRTIIIRHERGDEPDFLNTLWTVRLARGVMLGVGAALISWPVARFYGHPLLAWLLPIAGLNLVMEGFISTKFYSCDRHMQLARPTLINLGTYALSIAFTVLGAWWFRSVWALIWGALIGNLVKVFLSHLALPGPSNRFHWDRAAWHEVAEFGKWVFLSSITTFLAEQMDRLLFAKLIPFAMLGVYSIAVGIARLPRVVVLRVSSSIVMPSLSHVRQNPDDMRRVFNDLRLKILLGGGAMISFLTLCGPTLISLLYPRLYWDAGWILQVSCIGAWFTVLGAPHSPALLMQGHPRWQALGMALKAAVMMVVVPWAFVFFGFPGAIVAFGVVESIRYFIESAKVRKSGLKDWSIEAVMSAAMIGFGLAAVGLDAVHFAGSPRLHRLIAPAVWLAVWIPVAAWYFRRRSRPA